MQVTWAWAFLDLADEGRDAGVDQQVEFWRQVTRTTLSPWRGEHREFATLLPTEGDPWLKVQCVDGTGGVHVDLEVDDIAAAGALVRELGATVVEDLGSLVVCRSPGGFAFCLVAAGAGLRQVRRGQASLLDQVCLDIPADRYGAELAFWVGLTGWAAPRPAPDASGLLPLTRPSGLPLRLLTQRLGEVAGEVTREVNGHVDLACADRAAELHRHRELGATVESEHEHWSVLVAPGGSRYCLTDRDPGTGLLA